MAQIWGPIPGRGEPAFGHLSSVPGGIVALGRSEGAMCGVVTRIAASHSGNLPMKEG